MAKNLPASAGDAEDPGQEGPGGGHGTPLQRSCLRSPADRGAREAAVHGAAESQTGLSD